jgi:hypothetical protein
MARYAQCIAAYSPALVASKGSLQHVLSDPRSEGTQGYFHFQFVILALSWLAAHSPTCNKGQRNPIIMLFAVK